MLEATNFIRFDPVIYLYLCRAFWSLWISHLSTLVQTFLGRFMLRTRPQICAKQICHWFNCTGKAWRQLYCMFCDVAWRPSQLAAGRFLSKCQNATVSKIWDQKCCIRTTTARSVTFLKYCVQLNQLRLTSSFVFLALSNVSSDVIPSILLYLLLNHKSIIVSIWGPLFEISDSNDGQLCTFDVWFFVSFTFSPAEHPSQSMKYYSLSSDILCCAIRSTDYCFTRSVVCWTSLSRWPNFPLNLRISANCQRLHLGSRFWSVLGHPRSNLEFCFDRSCFPRLPLHWMIIWRTSQACCIHISQKIGVIAL